MVFTHHMCVNSRLQTHSPFTFRHELTALGSLFSIRRLASPRGPASSADGSPVPTSTSASAPLRPSVGVLWGGCRWGESDHRGTSSAHSSSCSRLSRVSAGVPSLAMVPVAQRTGGPVGGQRGEVAVDPPCSGRAMAPWWNIVDR